MHFTPKDLAIGCVLLFSIFFAFGTGYYVGNHYDVPLRTQYEATRDKAMTMAENIRVCAEQRGKANALVASQETALVALKAQLEGCHQLCGNPDSD